jgi:hypothetical protein
MFGEVADVKPLGCSDLVKMFGEVADVKPLLSGSWDLELEAEHAAALFVVAFFCVKIHKIPVGAVLLPLFPVASTVCQNTNAELQRRPNPQALVKEGSIHSKQNYITLGPRPRPPVVLLPLPCLPAVRLRRLPHPLSTWRRRPRLPRRAGLAACSCTGGGGERPPRPRPAHLPDHQRFCIKGRVYPAILPVPGNQVNGKVRPLTVQQCRTRPVLAAREAWLRSDLSPLWSIARSSRTSLIGSSTCSTCLKTRST